MIKSSKNFIQHSIGQVPTRCATYLCSLFGFEESLAAVTVGVSGAPTR